MLLGVGSAMTGRVIVQPVSSSHEPTAHGLENAQVTFTPIICLSVATNEMRLRCGTELHSTNAILPARNAVSFRRWLSARPQDNSHRSNAVGRKAPTAGRSEMPPVHQRCLSRWRIERDFREWNKV